MLPIAGSYQNIDLRVREIHAKGARALIPPACAEGE